MRRTGFRFYPTAEDCPQDVRMAFVDEKGIISPTVTAFRTMANVTYNLDPDPKKPWFKIVDATDTDRLHGRWMNHPKFSSKEILPTAQIIEIQTADGTQFSTWKYTDTTPTPKQRPDNKQFFNTTPLFPSQVFH